MCLLEPSSRGGSHEYHDLYFEQKYEIYRNFLSENFHFLVVKCLVYLNRHDFVIIFLMTSFRMVRAKIILKYQNNRLPYSDEKTNPSSSIWHLSLKALFHPAPSVEAVHLKFLKQLFKVRSQTSSLIFAYAPTAALPMKRLIITKTCLFKYIENFTTKI